MIHVYDIQVIGLNRAINAVNNSFNVGPIDTRSQINSKDKKWIVAKNLGCNKDELQSHDAWLSGVLVNFTLTCDPDFVRILAQEPYFRLKPLKGQVEQWFVSTNFRALKHFNRKRPDITDFWYPFLKCEDFKTFTDIDVWVDPYDIGG